ncbi:ATP-binding protein [Pseudonocardia bannensis]|uniref:histidine kinase n=1 Tax=Pseudonocardia bannensis TaxID=630973 RepID=A0A848DLI0_9PSEU|nr:sensor histidine kinase [Pseudonocardia bannensis]NMH93568.1 sensor histidine kinase [Pseudonocardia bannensis]
MPRRRGSRLVRQLLLLQIVTVLVTVGGVTALEVFGAQQAARSSTGALTLATAQAMAANPDVAAALRGDDPSAVLQPLAQRVQLNTGTAFVVIMSPDGIRYSHADPARIGERYIGTIAPAAAGTALTELYTGTLGPSVRSVVPVFADGRVVGLVSVGQLEEKIGDQVLHQLPAILGASVAAIGLGGVLAWLLARRVRRQTLGLEPEEIAAAYAHHDAVLHAVREGLLVVDADGRVVVVNAEARRLLGLAGDAPVEGRTLTDLDVDAGLRAVVGEPTDVRDVLALAGERVLLVSRTAAGPAAGGTRVVTLRDRTELADVVRQRDDARGRAQAMAGQAHEFANRMQTVLTLVQLGSIDDALRAGSAAVQRARGPAEELIEPVGNPVLAAVLADKAWAASERGVELRVIDEGTEPDGPWEPDDLVTLLGNLIDNALDAVASTGRTGEVQVQLSDGAELVIEVRDTGPGIPADAMQDVFAYGWSTKSAAPDRPRGIGLALVSRVARRLGGSITVAAATPGTVFTVRLPRPVPASPAPTVVTNGTFDQ